MSNYNVIIPHYSVMLADGLAKIIQEQYEFKHQISMELLASAMNDIYRVHSGEYTYYIRVPRHERFWPFSRETYEFEMDLLAFLRKSDLAVSYPIPTKNKSYLGILNAPEGIRYYAMYTEAVGEQPDVANLKQMTLMGQYLAKLHHASEQFESTHQGVHWDFDLLIDYGMHKLEQHLPEDLSTDFSWLKRKTKELITSFYELIPTPNDQYWGLIHGGFAPKNIRISNNQVMAFDFEYCGYGYRIFDLVFMLNQTNLRDPNNKYFRAFVEGYQQQRFLTEEEIRAIPLLSRLSLISQMTVSTGMRDLVGVLWFDHKVRQDLSILKKVL